MKDVVFSKVISWGSIKSAADQFISKGGQGEISISRAQSDLIPIGQILLAIAIGVLLIVGAIMGVKYMISGADERANMKQKLIWYIVAAVLVFGSVGIYNIVVGTINSSGL